MFEKEAEKFKSDLELIYKKGVLDGYNKALEEQGDKIESAYREGVAFGKDKLKDEWHYVKDGGYPKENVPLLCVRDGKIYVAWYYNGVYHDDRCCQVKKPYAWKEITFPKED